MVEPTPCRGCKAPVYWLKNNNTGGPAPIDAAPAANGNIQIDLDAGTYTIVNKSLFDEAAKAGKPLYLNHFVTCPQRAKFKKK